MPRPSLESPVHRALSLVIGAAAFAISTPAAADDSAAPLVTGPPVVSDGQPHAVVLTSPAFQPDARVKLTVGGEKREDFDLSQPGLLRFEVAAPAGATGPLAVVVKGRSAAGKVDAEVSVPLVAVSARPVGITFEPALFRVGTDEAVQVQIDPPAGLQALDRRAFSVHSSAGVIDTLTPLGDGRYAARWTPPKSFDGSQVVLFMVSEDNRPGQVYGAGALPVMVAAPVTLDAPAGSTNLLETAGRTYGPFKAGPKGKVRFEAEIDPRNPAGTLTTATDGGKDVRDVELLVAAGPRLTFLPPPEGLPADPDLRFDVVLYGLTAGGRELDPGPVVTADRGTITGVKKGRIRGTWVASYQPPPNPGAVVLTATAGDLEVKRTTRVVAAPPPPRAALVADPDRVGPAVTELQVRATLKTEGGQAVVGAAPRLQFAGGGLQGALSDGGDGTYQGTVEVTFAPVLVAVAPPLSPTGLPAAHLVAWVEPAATAGDAPAALMVGVTDLFGHGVAGVPVQLVGQGAQVAPSGTPGETGLLALPIQRTGDGAGAVQVTAAGLTRGVALLADGSGDGSPLVVGPAADQARVAAWRDRTAAVVVPRLRAPVAAAAPLPAPGAPLPAPGVPTAAPGTPAAPGAPAAASAPAAAPKASRGGGGISARVSGALSLGSHQYAAAAEASPSVPNSTSFDTGGLGSVPGLHARAVVRFNPNWAADVRARAWTERVDLRSEETSSGSIDFHAGARYIYPVFDWLEPYGVAGVDSVTAPVFSYGNLTRTALALDRQRALGLRLGVGAVVAVGPVHGRVEFGETFAAAPSVHQLDTELAVKVIDPLAVRVGFQVEGWSLRGLEVADTEADVTGTLTQATVGVTWLVP